MVVANPPLVNELETSIAQTYLRGLNSACVLYKNIVGGAQDLCYAATLD